MKKVKYISLLIGLLCSTSFVAQGQSTAFGTRLENTLNGTPLQAGQTIVIDGTTYVAGVNTISNPSFEEMNADGTYPYWTSGTYAPLSSQYFTYTQNGGYDGGYCITATQNVGASEAGSIATRWSVTPYTKYYFSYQVKGLTGNSSYIPVLTLTSINSTAGGQNEGVTEATMLIGATDYQKGKYGYSTYTEDGTTWGLTALAFDADKDVFLQFNARYLCVNDQYVSFDDFRLMPLYPVLDNDVYTTLKQIYQQRGQEVLTFVQTVYTKYPQFYALVAQELATELGLPEVPADLAAWQTALMANIPQTAEELQVMLSKIEDLYIQVKMEYNAMEAMPALLTKEKALIDNCTAHSDIINASTMLQTLYTEAKGQYDAVLEWYNGNDKALGQYYTFYNIAISQLNPLTGVEAMVRLRLAIDAAKAGDTANPSVIDGAEEYYTAISTSDKDGDALYAEVPTIENWITRLNKVWKIRIHMGTEVGTFAERLAKYVDSYDEVEWLLVTGMMNSEDCKILGSLKNLQYLDLAGITSMEIGTDLSLHVDNLPTTQRPDINLIHSGSTYGMLTFEGTGTFAMKSFSMNYDHYDANKCSLINKDVMGANSVTVRYLNPNAKWDFVSFPFNVKVADIKPLFNNQDICIREYSGENRAAGDMDNTWIDVPSNGTLNAGQGYIIQSPTRYTDEGTSYGYSAWEIPAVKDASMNNIFRKDAVTVTLKKYATDDSFSHNVNWNLIGNPFPSYFDIKYLDFDGPVIVWTGTTYKTYTASEEYTFNPGEAFFVQRPGGDDGDVVFNPEGRYNRWILVIDPIILRTKRKAKTTPQNDMRIVLSDGTSQDETRVIVSDGATMDYEIGSDAVKFMSPEKAVPQIYSHAIETKGTESETVTYSVNERPLGTGSVNLGMYIPADGDYTMTLTGGNALLEDIANGITTELADGQTYSFSAKAGTHDGRFVLHLQDSTNGIVQMENGEWKMDNSAMYNIAGQRVTSVSKGVVISNGKKHVVK